MVGEAVYYGSGAPDRVEVLHLADELLLVEEVPVMVQLPDGRSQGRVGDLVVLFVIPVFVVEGVVVVVILGLVFRFRRKWNSDPLFLRDKVRRRKLGLPVRGLVIVEGLPGVVEEASIVWLCHPSLDNQEIAFGQPDLFGTELANAADL